MDYRALIANPRAVCDDWFFRLISTLPGHPVLWAALLGLCFPLVTQYLETISEPIAYVRSVIDLPAAYFFIPLLLVQTVAMPAFYQSVLRCFDELRYLMTTSASETAANRAELIVPGTRFQGQLLAAALLTTLLLEELFASRYSRFMTGDWNILDLWLVFSNSLTLVTFIWFMVMPISRTLLLARQIEKPCCPGCSMTAWVRRSAILVCAQVSCLQCRI